jgi:hypothetical protein
MRQAPLPAWSGWVLFAVLFCWLTFIVAADWADARRAARRQAARDLNTSCRARRARTDSLPGRDQ